MIVFNRNIFNDFGFGKKKYSNLDAPFPSMICQIFQLTEDVNFVYFSSPIKASSISWGIKQCVEFSEYISSTNFNLLEKASVQNLSSYAV